MSWWVPISPLYIHGNAFPGEMGGPLLVGGVLDVGWCHNLPARALAQCVPPHCLFFLSPLDTDYHSAVTFSTHDQGVALQAGGDVYGPAQSAIPFM